MDCPGVDPTVKSKLEQDARGFNVELERDKATPELDRFREAKIASEKFIEEALKLPIEQQTCLLKSAQSFNNEIRVSDPDLPNVNVVFSNKGKDLARFQLSYPHLRGNGAFGYVGNYTESRENIDLFAP